MTDDEFKAMSKAFAAFVGLEMGELQTLLKAAGQTAEGNFLQLVLGNMERRFGHAGLRHFYKECGQKGILV